VLRYTDETKEINKDQSKKQLKEKKEHNKSPNEKSLILFQYEIIFLLKILYFCHIIHPNIDIFTYLTNKSITECIRPYHDRNALEKNQHSKIHVNQKDKNHN
jgi:hypothetical protein